MNIKKAALLQFLKNIKHRYRDDAQYPLPLASVSGVGGSHVAVLDWMQEHCNLAVVTSKSIQILPNLGNKEPIITTLKDDSIGNAVGLKNKGLEVSLREFEFFNRRRAILQSRNRDKNSQTTLPLFNISLAANTAQDFCLLAESCCPFADIIELNLSCPHAKEGYGSAIGSRPKLVERVTSQVRQSLQNYHTTKGISPLLAIKLTPNIPNIAEVAYAAQGAGADVLVAINTVGPKQYHEAHTKASILSNPPKGYGGLSGASINDIARKAISDIRVQVGEEIVIIGVGGVSSKNDVDAMLAAGADIVGIGSALSSVHQRDWPSFFTSLTHRKVGNQEKGTASTANPQETTARLQKLQIYKSESESDSPFTQIKVSNIDYIAKNNSEQPQKRESAAQTKPERGREQEQAREPEQAREAFIISSQQSYDCKLGQMLFIWLPHVGEKPYVPLQTNPLQFLIYPRGTHSRALMQLRAGQNIYVRGPYGEATKPESITDPAQALCLITQSHAIARVSSILQFRLGMTSRQRTQNKPAHNSTMRGNTAPTILLSDIESKPLTRVLSAMSLPLSFARAATIDDEASDAASATTGNEAANAPAGDARDKAQFIHQHYNKIDDIPKLIGAHTNSTHISSAHTSSSNTNSTRASDAQSYVLAGTRPFLDAVLEAVPSLREHLHCWLSVETHSSCGIGICGSCALGSRLICHHGSYIKNTDYIKLLTSYGALDNDN